jgi:hypothetical protein
VFSDVTRGEHYLMLKKQLEISINWSRLIRPIACFARLNRPEFNKSWQWQACTLYHKDQPVNLNIKSRTAKALATWSTYCVSWTMPDRFPKLHGSRHGFQITLILSQPGSDFINPIAPPITFSVLLNTKEALVIKSFTS